MYSSTYQPSGLPKYDFPGDAPTWDETNYTNNINNEVKKEVDAIPRVAHISAPPQPMSASEESFTLQFELEDEGTELTTPSVGMIIPSVSISLDDYSYGYVQHFISPFTLANGKAVCNVTIYNNATNTSGEKCSGTVSVSGITIL